MAAAIHAIRQKNAKKKEEEQQAYRFKVAAPVKKITGILSLKDGQGWRKFQPAAARLYNHVYVQVSVAGLIGLNFLVNIVQAQIDPTGEKMVDEFAPWEWFFNIVFLIELLLNMYSTWFAKFWKSSWNVFDFSVVLIGWMFQLKLPLPGPMKLLRMMRAFRVFRLFKRVESLRKIMSSLARAVPGVLQAFVIQLIIVCIYAIIAVDRFRDFGEDGTFTNLNGDTVELQTSRGQNFGMEYFGTFGKALYTMFQVLTAESWAEAVCRPLYNSDSQTTSSGSAFFFVFFSILNGVVLINVVVAVLLEKMVDEEPAPEESTGEGEESDALCEIPGIPQMQRDVQHMQGVVDLIENDTKVFAEKFSEMQQQLSDVDVIKDMVASLLAQEGLEVAFEPSELKVAKQSSLRASFSSNWTYPPSPGEYEQMTNKESKVSFADDLSRTMSFPDDPPTHPLGIETP